MVLWQYILIAALVLLGVVIRFIVTTIKLFRLRHIAKDYNRYVNQLYTQDGKPTPAIIARIQYDYINKYNEFLNRRYILKMFLGPIPIQGEEPTLTHLFICDDKLVYRYEN